MRREIEKMLEFPYTDRVSLVLSGNYMMTSHRLWIYWWWQESKNRKNANNDILCNSCTQQVPGAAPSDVTCSSSTAHSVTVSWEPPSRKHAHGNIVSFRVVLEVIPDDDEFPISYFSATGSTTRGASGSSTSNINSKSGFLWNYVDRYLFT